MNGNAIKMSVTGGKTRKKDMEPSQNRTKLARLMVVTTLLAVLSLLAPLGQISEAQDWGQPTDEKEVEGEAEVVEEPDAPAAGLFDGPSAAELDDIRSIAAEYNLSDEEAMRRFSWNDNFAQLVEEIRAEDPEVFAGAEITEDGLARIGFKAYSSASAQWQVYSFTSNFDVPVDVVMDLGYNERELLEAIEAAHMTAFETPGVVDASTSHDFETGEILTEIAIAQWAPGPWADEMAFGATELDAAAATVESNLEQQWSNLPDSLSFQVTASYDAALSGEESYSYHYGGELISGCTSGFGTRSLSHTRGTRGISTAGHCGNTQSDDGWRLDYRGGHVGSQGDFQWHTGARYESDDFYSGNSTSTEVNRRDVSRVGSPVRGQSLCRNGRTTDKHCQRVHAVNVCSSGVCNLVRMDRHLSNYGDSGGPIFWGNTAYGIHRGWMTTGWWPFRTKREIFSRADRIDNALGVFIATG